jgi:HemY protein
MRRLIVILLFLVASVWFGLTVVRHPGYLLLAYHPWMVQMPLWFAMLAFLVFFGLFYLIVNGVDKLQFFWYRIKNWLKFRREHKAFTKTQQGLSMLIEGRWYKAERSLLAGVQQSIDPLMNYLGAAKAAHEQKAFDRSHNYIKKAYQVAPKADLAIGLTQADLEISQDQLEQALATLTHLRKMAPRHPRVLRLLEKVYVRLGDWKNLQDLLPAMRKAKVLNAEQAEQFEKNIYIEVLSKGNKSLPEIHAIWNGMPRSMRKNPDVVCAYVKQLMVCQSPLEAEELIRKTLKSDWQAELAKIYGSLPLKDLNRQLVMVGAWLKMYGSKPEILLILGKLCMRVQLWGKAKDYFQKCLALGPNAEASLQYGKLLEELGEENEAVEKYRQGLAQLAG